jgi:hypothetical protein
VVRRSRWKLENEPDDVLHLIGFLTTARDPITGSDIGMILERLDPPRDTMKTDVDNAATGRRQTSFGY